MFKKGCRITKKRFEEIITRGKTTHSLYLYIRSLPSLDGIKKFSTVIPKKIYKKAHDRNLLKRRINYSIRLNQDLFNVSDYIFFTKDGIKKANFSDIDSDVKNIASKLK